MSRLVWPDEPPRHGGVVLRAFTPDDVPAVVELSHDPYVCDLAGLPREADAQAARRWIRRQQPRMLDLTGYSFCIADAVSGRALGRIGLWSRDLDEGRAELGYYVCPSARGRGVAADAVRALVPFAFTVPGLARLEAYVEPRNAASLTVLRRTGFVREGLLRSQRVVAGARRDMVVLSLLADEVEAAAAPDASTGARPAVSLPQASAMGS